MKKVRDGYKMTELGEIPSEWEVKNIGEVAKFQGGYAFKSSDYVEDGIRLVKITNVQQKNISWNEEDLLPVKYLEKFNEYKLQEDDVVIAMTRPIISTGIKVCKIEKRDLPCLLNQRVGRFIIKDSLISKYLYNYCFTDYFINKVKELCSTTGQPNISANQIESILITIPSVKEQEKIAAILSTVDEQIDNVDALIEKNKELKKGLMQTLLTKGIGHTKFKKTEIGEIPEEWQNESLGDMVNFEGGTQPPKKYFSNECLDGMIRLIQIRDYKSDKFKVYVPKELCRRFCDKSDVMIGRYGPPIFQILRGLEGAYNVALIKATPINERLDREYLYYFLNNEKLFNLIDSLSQRTSGQTGIDMEVLKAYKIPIPPKKEQEKIVLTLSQIDKRIENYENRNKKLEELKKGLMQQLLTGKIRTI